MTIFDEKKEEPFYCDELDKIFIAKYDWSFCPGCGKELSSNIKIKFRLPNTANTHGYSGPLPQEYKNV